MEQFFADFIYHLERQHTQIKEILADLPAEALDWVPGADMNSIAVLVNHTAGAERYWAADLIVNETSDRQRATEFKTKAVSAETLVKQLDASLAAIRPVLASLPLSVLAEERFSPPQGQNFTVGWALAHALEHTATHTGHIQITAQFWQQQESA